MNRAGSSVRGIFRALARSAFLPSRISSLAIATAVLAAISFQPLTPAQASALWSQSARNHNVRMAHAASQAAIDPAYHPPQAHGRSYIAPTAKGSPNGSLGPEKLTQRTRTSRTFASGGRKLTTVVYTDSVNYRDAAGSWQLIDDSLVKTSLAQYAYQNKANRYSVYLPADISVAPVRVVLGSSWLTFSLQGAKGAVKTSGSVATYANALPGVTVVVAAEADAVEESLVLQGPASQSEFIYLLQMSPGLKLKAAGAGFSVVDGTGRAVFRLAAPAMFDSSKTLGGRSSAISLSATATANGTTVTLKADPAWLGNSARKWPVTIDPTLILADSQDCYITGGSFAGTNFCGGTMLNAGYDGTQASRALLQFNLQSIPTTDTVLSAKLLLYLGAASTSNSTSLSLYQLTHAWTSAATWNTYDGVNAWTSAGGDFAASAAATTNGIAATAVWYSWSPTQLVQGWVNGSIANDGLIVKEPTENVTNVLSFNSSTGGNPPYLQIVHQQGGQAPGSYSTSVQGDSPVAYWRMDETSGSTMVDAQSVDSGTYQGGFTLAQTSLIQPASGTSVSFNGSTGYGTASTLTALQGANTRSLELWFKTSYDGGEPLFDSGTAGSNYQSFNLQLTGPNTMSGNPPPPNTSGIFMQTWNEDFYLPGLSLADGKRHHVVVEVSGSNLWVYVDNALPKGFLYNGGWNTRYLLSQPFSLANALNTVGNPILIGNTRYNAGGASNFFQGQIDEVAVYSTALSATQVQNHWQAGNGLPWTPTSLSATPGQNQVALSWTAPTFNGSGITGYVVTPQVGSTLRTPITFNSPATTETITNLSGGTAYTFGVSAINTLGTGIPSALSSAATPTGSAIPLYEDTALADSPVGFWPLGETSGNLATDLTQSADGQDTGAYTQGDAGPVIRFPNNAINLSGSNAYVRLHHATLLEPAAVTLEAWIKPSAVPANDTVIVISPQSGNSEWSTNGYDLVLLGSVNGGNGKVTFNAGASVTTPAALPLGVWSYVVGTSDATATRLYVNGKQQAAVAGPAPNYGGAPNFDALVTRFGYPGDVADVAIYGSALTASQVAVHYAAAGYAPGPISNLVATASTNSARLIWTAPAYIGTGPITSYTVTPIVDGKPSTPISISGNGTGANIPNLPGGASYTFQVQANNASGAGVIVTTSAVTIGSPAAGPGGFGTYLYMRGGPGQGQPFAHYGLVSRNNVTAMSSWTLEERLWGWNSLSVTGGHSALGLLSGTPTNPTDQNPIAGLNFNLGGNPLQTYFVWPGGGSCTIPSDPQGLPLAFDASVTTPVHVALSYDSTTSTVRGFINGTLVSGCSVATASAAVPAAPFGFMDNSGLNGAYFDEVRVSNTARYTANFTPPTQQFTTDGNTMVLWRFNDYAISKLPSTHIVPNQNDGGIFSSGLSPSTYRDSSGNINHANTIWGTGAAVGGSDDWRRPYSLGQGVTADELTGGESPWLCPCTMSSTARPVNDATGEFYHTFADFHIPGRIDLDFTRTYSSLRTNTLGPTGYGWTDNYNQYLSFDGSGNATVHAANGSAVVFTFTAPNTYTGPPSEHVTLVKNGDNTFTLTDPGQNQTVFNTTSANNISTLHQLIDRHHSTNYTLALNYNLPPPDDQLVTSVVDPAGRTLSFSYTTVGGIKLISSVADNGSPVRTVQFQYGLDSAQPSYQTLIQVTDVATGVTTFEYDATRPGGAKHYLWKMHDPNGGVTTNTYDSSNRISSQQEPITTRTTSFDYSNGVTTITDPNGNKVQEEYLNGILLSRTVGYNTPQAATWTYSFDPAAVGLTAAVGPNGETVTTVRDSSGNVLSETDGLGRTTNYTYNSFAEPLTIQDPTSVTTTNTYNATGDLATTARPLIGGGQTQTITYNHTDVTHPGDVTSMVDADNNTWTYTYDANGYRSSVKDALGNLTTYLFNSKGWLTSSVAPNGNTTRQDTFVRSAVSGSWGTATDGNPWTLQAGTSTYSTTGTQGKMASPSSDSFESLGPGLPLTGGEILVRWQVASATKDKAGAVLRMSASANTYYGVRFDAAGHVELFGKWGGTVHTNIGSVRVNYSPGTNKQWFRFRVQGTTLYYKVWADGTSEPANWTGQTTDTNVSGPGLVGLYGNPSNTTGVKFDQFTATALQSDATTSYTYNNFGQRTGLTDPLGHNTTWHYDPNQNLDQITDADNNLSTNVYDADNELTQVKRADSPQTTLVTDYNPDGTILDQKDGKGNAIQTYQYDSLAHVTTVTDALSNVITFVYDANGNLLSKQDPGGNCSATPPTGCTTYSYDAANQLTSITYSDGVTPNVTNITYDADGQRTSMTDGTGTSSWGWDSLHRMVSYQNGHADLVQWAYNLRNLPVTITYPGPLNVSRNYDNAGRWTSVTDWNSKTTTFGYDPDGNLTTETFPSPSTVVDTFTFNAADQMTAATSQKAGSSQLPFPATYTRDNANQLTSDGSSASGTGSYKYTTLNQLCYAGSSNSNACTSPPTGSIAYRYDAADNLTQKGSVQQAFNNADELCWTASTTGSCASPPTGATTFQYDTRGNRTNVNPSGGQAQILTYDQANRMTKFAAVSTTSYGYNGDGLRMCKYSGSSSQPCSAVGATQFLWDVAGSLPALIKDGSTNYVYGPGGLPLEQVSGSTTYWYHHDQVGSTRLITDSTGVPQATYTYDPYGGLASSTGSIVNPLRFVAQYQDAESGVYYLRARYYDPTTAQFLSVDPVSAKTRQPFGYVEGNPLSGTDPSGLCGWDFWTCNWGAAINVAVTQVPQIRPTENDDPNYNAFAPDPIYLAQQNYQELSNPNDWGSTNAYRVATDDAKFGLYLGTAYVGCRGLAWAARGLSWAARATGASRWAASNPLIGRAGPIFGSRGILNYNDVLRMGWSRGPVVRGQADEVFRVAVGNKGWPTLPGLPKFPWHWDW